MKSKNLFLSTKATNILIIVASLFLILTAVILYTSIKHQTIPVNAQLKPGYALNEIPRSFKDVLMLGMPNINNNTPKEAVVIKEETFFSVKNLMRNIIYALSNVDIKDTRTWLSIEIPIISNTKQAALSAMTLPNFPKFDPNMIVNNGKPLVGIYHTHTSESFVPSSGVSHRPSGQAGDIVEVGQALIEKLKECGIEGIQSKNIHDYPSFMKAYSPSEQTSQKMLKESPTIQMIFDIHRDADKRENSLVVLNGKEVARISIVVGKGQQDLLQPHWQQNHAFAKLIEAKLNHYYPGISKGIQLVDWRYNQHLHPRALLLEVGCQDNTKEEAIRAIECLASVIAEIVAENK